MPTGETSPLVSVVMAFHNGAPYLRDAAASVLGQSHRSLELLLCDDASTDGAPAIAASLAVQDARVRVLSATDQAGPGATRNLALDAARGDWIAIVDADDLLHPDRIAGLLAAAELNAADVIADDLVPFGAESGTTLLSALGLTGPWRPDARDLIRAEQGARPVAVGYLKPMIRRRALGTLRYRSDLSIGEDLDLLLRLVLSGASLTVLPTPWYLYRRHTGSTSHRLSAQRADAILAGIDALAAAYPGWADTAAEPLAAWRARIARASAFGDLVESLKRRRFGASLGMLRRAPGLSVDLMRAMSEGLARRMRPGPAREDRRPLVLSAASAFGTATGTKFAVPHGAQDWDAARAARLARLTGSGTRHLRAIGRSGLAALGHVPGWRLAELTPPPGGWNVEEKAAIARLPWPILHVPQETAPEIAEDAPDVHPSASGAVS
jgi:succinoglycan biosynthesis protein ExoO